MKEREEAPTTNRTAKGYEGIFKGIEAVHRTEQVREQLLSAIQRGDLKPGDALPSERALAEIFDVSRVSVREAIRSLEAIGLLKVEHGRGCFVLGAADGRRPTSSWLDLYRTEVMDLLEVRGAVDQVVAEGAARRADQTELSRVQSAHEAYAQAAADPQTPISTIVDLDIAFHEAVGRASGNALAAHLLQDLNSYLEESRRIVLSPEGRPTASGYEHKAIVEAIMAHRPDEARAAAARHVEAVRKLLKDGSPEPSESKAKRGEQSGG